jgi:hypothetical protein
MDDKLKKENSSLVDNEITELSDDMLDNIAGGYVYHDAGDAAAHRKEGYYVVDDHGEIVMRFDNMASAKHWASNLRTSQKVITADEFELLRKNGKL